jgi:hypothetical protein
MADTIQFTIGMEANSMANGKITAIRVTNLRSNVQYEWNTGSWNSEGVPKMQSGDKFYISAWAVNNGTAGNMVITVTNGAYYQRASAYIAAGDGIGVEYTMTEGLVSATQIVIQVTP